MNTAGKKNKRISRITKFESDFLKIKEEIAHKNGFALGPVLEVGVLELRNVRSSQ